MTGFLMAIGLAVGGYFSCLGVGYLYIWATTKERPPFKDFFFDLD